MIDTDNFDPDDYDDPEPRRPRGYLALDVNNVLREFIASGSTLPEGEFLTPWKVARMIKEDHQIDKAPSSGAVDAVFKRWDKIGYASFRQVPFAFLDFTSRGQELGFEGFMREVKLARKTGRK